MKLYHYTTAADKILQEGFITAELQENPGILKCFANAAQSDNHQIIRSFLQKRFPGRLRTFSGLTEKIPHHKNLHCYLQKILSNKDFELLELDVKQLNKDGFIEAVYCKDNTKTIEEQPFFENIFRLKGIQEIDTSPLNFDACDEKHSPYNKLRHYMLVIRGGIIPPKYLNKIKK